VDRFKALKTEHDADRQKIADLEAELKAVKDEQTTRLDRIEQLLASTDRQPEDTGTPKRSADEPSTSRDQDASLDNRRASIYAPTALVPRQC
jgi:predicted  nucleic acid-binding Zn-ribbon protein